MRIIFYSGMAQAFLLDQLSPEWKLRAFEADVWLEELLAEAKAIKITLLATP